MALTETSIRKMAPPVKPVLVSDPATTGLYLRCYPTGRKTWLYRTRKGGDGWKTQNLGLWPSVGMAQARAKAAALGTTVLPDAVTFGQLLDEWFAHRIEPRYKQTKNAQVYVTKGKTWLGNQKLSQLTTQQLVQRLQTYAKDSPVAANRCLSAWKLALDYAAEVGYLTANPLARTTTRAAGGEERTRARVLTDDELRWVLRLDHPQYGPLLRALLLTGLRISEAQAGTADHLDGGTWHWVAVVPLLKKQFGDFDDYLFAVRSPTAVQTWMKRHEVGFTPHDLRRTFATRLAGLGVAPHVVEKCLNHQMQGVMATYNRHDYETERKAAAVAWEAELKRINGKAKNQTAA
jgi:integrase